MNYFSLWEVLKLLRTICKTGGEVADISAALYLPRALQSRYTPSAIDEGQARSHLSEKGIIQSIAAEAESS